MINLETDITKINRVGITTAKRLERLGIKTVYDLLLYFPYRYEDYRAATPIADLKSGQSANIVGQIELIQNKRSPRKRMNITEALVSDDTEQIKVIWFNQPFIVRNLRVGDMVSLAGKIDHEYGSEIMRSPVYEKLANNNNVHTQGLVPVYSLTANLTHKQIRFLIKQAVSCADKINDWLPKYIIQKHKFLSLGQAIKKIHFPSAYPEIDSARRRLSFNELFLIQLQSQLIRRELLSSQAIAIKFHEEETRAFVNQLPFSLTKTQKQAAWEILQDIARERPMARLLEGDVGSGKTIVAVLAMLNTALSGKQAVLMVPTEILARQHYNSISKLLKNFKIKTALLTRSQYLINTSGQATKKIILGAIKDGQAKIIIGTHALLQENVVFNNLSLAIIDEQHRFGVEQRKILKEKSGDAAAVPHLLSMTATPIPRSLALALYGDLDLSVITELPRGRKSIITRVVPEQKRNQAYKFIREEIKKGRQIFVICPLIDVSDKLGVKSVKEEYQKLDQQIFPDIPIGMLHGKLKPREKEAVMQDFLDNKIKILVSTSVIEVGVDIPNAAIMMIEGAERFGLAQLHQFRGRVGRSERQSYCFLFTDSDQEKSLKRLRALVDCDDGFALAKMDLKFRGPGQVFGAAQKGFPELKIATLFDYELMKLAQTDAKELASKDPSLNSWPLIQKKIAKLTKLAHPE